MPRRRAQSAALPAAAVLVLTLLSPGPATAVTAPAQASATSSAGAAAAVAVAWQRTAIATVFPPVSPSPIPVGTLYLGLTSLAMYDAVQRAQDRDRTSAVAAAAVAAHDVLAEYFPASTSDLDAALAASLAGVRPGPAKWRGSRIGAAAAAELIARRVDDGRDDPSIVYQRDPAPGVWQPTTGVPMLAPWLGFVRPLVIGQAVSMPGPYALTSARYTKDYDEVRRLGSAASSARTSAQTDTALFFTTNATVMLSEGVLAHLDANPLSLRRTVRLLAAMHGAMADAVISGWRLKFDVGFWRPFQAIAGAVADGNPTTTAEPGWASLLPVPPYPEYVSGHAVLTASAAEVIRRLLGDDTRLTLHSSTTGTGRSYATLSSLEADALASRIWGGLHFRTAMDDGYRVGHRTAVKVLRRLE